VPGPFYFAWAGGAIEPQITVITNGTTHGAIFETVAIVGDIAGSNQLTRLATNQGLEPGAFYQLSGSGIAPGTYFVDDETILSGQPDSINLSQNATTTLHSATFEATKSVGVGVVLGTFSQGSANVTIDDAGGLPAGTYGCYATPIGQTNIPVGTSSGTTYVTGGGIMIIGSCYIHFNGFNFGQMAILAASPHTTTTIDMFGQTVSATFYTVAEQAVVATTSGQFPLQLSGFPTGDRAQITGIPSAALMGLTPGLRYNISGNGIPIGATFVAPSSGSTSIEMDVLATTSEVNAILTITGPRTPNAPFDPVAHARFDEEIVSLEISQEEGAFATLTVELKNPDVGLLATGRNLWCWLSWDQNWTPSGGSVSLTPLFNGRLIGVPKLQANEIVQLQFLARPDDLNVQKLTLSNSLQVLPYYDPVWLATTTTPDTVLETYSALWHIDRVTLNLTVSDIIAGEDGTVNIGEDQAIYDKFSLAYGEPPLTATAVSGTVAWQQEGEGTIDVTQTLLNAFHAQGSAYQYTFAVGNFNSGGGGLIQVLCGDGMKTSWPKPGTVIGGGWSLSTRNDGTGYPLCYITDAVIQSAGGWMTPLNFSISYAAQMPMGSVPTAGISNGAIYTNPYGQFTLQFPINLYKIRMNLDYNADRRRTETITAVVTAGVQRELSDPAESDRETISMTSEFVGQGVDPDGALPIGNLAHRSYFQTGRGAASFEYLLLAARAKMRARARSVDVTFGVNWATALTITLRKSVQLTDRRLPGGVCTGKVKSYKLSAGTSGMFGEFTIGCTIGTGGASTAQAGVPVYVDTGYVSAGYEAVSGAQITLDPGDFSYESLDDFVIEDDGLDVSNLSASTAVNECIVFDGLKVQLPILSAYNNTVAPTNGSALQAMRTMTTTVTLDLRPVAGQEFHTEFTPAVSELVIPKTIDLSAG
jgi:hypothetical protein